MQRKIYMRGKRKLFFTIKWNVKQITVIPICNLVFVEINHYYERQFQVDNNKVYFAIID